MVYKGVGQLLDNSTACMMEWGNFFSLYRHMYYIDHKILKTSTKTSVSHLLSPTCVYQRQSNVIAKMTTKGLGQVDKNDAF